MREAESSKLLIPWIEYICDSEEYAALLRWVDKRQKIFFLSWTHKSSTNWDSTKSDVFKKWAEYKRKLGEKDDRDFKAAFRNALRSKKNSIRLLEKGKEHRIWQILSEPIRPRKSETTNNKKKPRQRKGSKKSAKTCKPVEDLGFLEPPPSSSCSSMFQDEFGTLPPISSLLHVSPPSSPLQQTEGIVSNLGTLRKSPSVNDSTYRIPTPNIHSSPLSPAYMSADEPLYGVPSPNVHSSPLSPAFMSADEPQYGVPSPNIHPTPLSPAYISGDEPLYGVPSPNVYSSPCSPIQMLSNDTQNSAWDTLINFPPASMSPEQQVPAIDINDYLFASEMGQYQAQDIAKSNGVQWCQTKDEDLVPHQNLIEIMFDIKQNEHSLLPVVPDLNQDALGKISYLEFFDDNMWSAPERLHVDGYDSLNLFTCHQL